jgi:hypothetical protein
MAACKVSQALDKGPSQGPLGSLVLLDAEPAGASAWDVPAAGVLAAQLTMGGPTPVGSRQVRTCHRRQCVPGPSACAFVERWICGGGAVHLLLFLTTHTHFPAAAFR